MSEMRKNELHSDVTIICQENEFKAHKNILAARSDVFTAMFAHDTKETQTSRVEMDDCEPKIINPWTLPSLNHTRNDDLDPYISTAEFTDPFGWIRTQRPLSDSNVGKRAFSTPARLQSALPFGSMLPCSPKES
jgi:hypothetical protein